MGSAKPVVLIVDDEPLNRDLLMRVLESDFDVLSAEDGEQASDILGSDEGERVGVVLCDHWMPGKTGVELAEEVREKMPRLPFVLITGFDQEKEVTDAKGRGVLAAVMPKPWRTKELRALIVELLG